MAGEGGTSGGFQPPKFVTEESIIPILATFKEEVKAEMRTEMMTSIASFRGEIDAMGKTLSDRVYPKELTYNKKEVDDKIAEIYKDIDKKIIALNDPKSPMEDLREQAEALKTSFNREQDEKEQQGHDNTEKPETEETAKEKELNRQIAHWKERFEQEQM